MTSLEQTKNLFDTLGVSYIEYEDTVMSGNTFLYLEIIQDSGGKVVSYPYQSVQFVFAAGHPHEFQYIFVMGD